MKKILALLLLIATLLSIASCGEGDYPPVESTELEAQTVMTMTIDDTQYTVRYELYRMLFLSVRDEVDGGDSSVWTGDNKAEYIKRADDVIKRRVSEIYSIMHIANKVGIDVHSSEFDNIVNDYIKASVESDYYDEIAIEGFDGDYDKYLEHLKTLNMNYSVQDLLIRYSYATEKIYEYYAGNLEGEFLEEAVKGALEYTKDDVRAFYDSDECVRVLRAHMPIERGWPTEKRVGEIHAAIVDAAKYGKDEVAECIIDKTTTAPVDVFNGAIVARHSHDTVYYEEYVNLAFSLDFFEVSDVIEVATPVEAAYFVLYRIAKESSHFEECYDSIASVYVQNEIGKIIDTAAATLYESAQTTENLNNLNRANISME